MTTRAARIVAVGAPQAFRQQVARALSTDAEGVEWVPSVTAVEESLSNGGIAADVLVVSPGIKEADAFGLAEFVGRSTPATAVVLVRERPMNGLLPAAMRSGIRDVVDLSKGSEDLRDALQRAIAWSANVRGVGVEPRAEVHTERGLVVSVFSSKGGTGKSFLSSNLGAALAARSNREVALVDLDLEMGDLFSYFGAESNRALQDLAAGGAVDPEAIVALGGKLAQNIRGYGAPYDPGSPPIPGEVIGTLLRAIRHNFGFVVVDCPASYSDHALAALELSDVICLVAGLDIVGVRHLSVALQTLLSLGVPRDRFRVVMNRADSKVGLSVEEVEKVMNVKVDTLVPSSRLVPMALNKGLPVYLDEPKSSVAKSLEGLADKLIALMPSEQSAKRARRGLFRKG